MTELKAGRELDAEIASKVMGWTNVGCESNAMHTEFVPHGKPPIPDASTYLGRKLLPKYSTDIAAAWEVVEKLRLLGWLVVVKEMPDGVPYISDHSKIMSRSVVSLQWVRWMMKDCPDDQRDYFRHDEITLADSAPLAICLAALKTVEHIPESPSVVPVESSSFGEPK